MRPEDEGPILKWHDWFALGHLIFAVHEFQPPESGADPADVTSLYFHQLAWKRQIVETHLPGELAALKELLSTLEGKGWTVRPSVAFQGEL